MSDKPKAKKPRKKAKRPKGKKPGEEVEKKSLKISDEERQRRSEAMKKLHAEGKAGGKFGHLGGRPRKKRAAEVVAEGVANMGDDMLAVLKDAMDPDNPKSIRLKAVEAAIKIEEKEARLQLDEDEALARMSRGEIIDHLIQQFSSNPMVLEMFKMAGSKEPPKPVESETEIDGELIEEATVVSD